MSGRVIFQLVMISATIYIPYYLLLGWISRRWGSAGPNLSRTPATSSFVLTLNVGGVTHRTTPATLRAHPASHLARMFTAPNGSVPPPDPFAGEYFIDRDGRWFRFILDYLRDGEPDALARRLNLDDRAALHQESRFYGFPELQTALAVAQEQELFLDLLDAREDRAHLIAKAHVHDEERTADFLRATKHVIAALAQHCIHRPFPRCSWHAQHYPLVDYPDPYVLFHQFADLLFMVGFDISVLGTYGARGSAVVVELLVRESEWFRVHKYLLPSPIPSLQ